MINIDIHYNDVYVNPNDVNSRLGPRKDWDPMFQMDVDYLHFKWFFKGVAQKFWAQTRCSDMYVKQKHWFDAKQ